VSGLCYAKALRPPLLKLPPYRSIGEAVQSGRAAVWLASDNADYVHDAIGNRTRGPIINTNANASVEVTPSLFYFVLFAGFGPGCGRRREAPGQRS
jgi:hypothetical protein